VNKRSPSSVGLKTKNLSVEAVSLVVVVGVVVAEAGTIIERGSIETLKTNLINEES